MKTEQSIGFIGLGLMGAPMAMNILRKGYPLTVYNRTREKADELKKAGAAVVDTPAQLASRVDIMITMVTNAEAVEQVLFGEDGVVTGKHKSLTLVDMSTIGLTAARSIAQRLTPHHITYIDAPVSGSTPKAAAGELTIFMGGDQQTVEQIKPILQCMGKTIVYVGSSGSGQAVKMINNFLLGAQMEAVAEGMLLADIMQLPREKAAEALRQTQTISESAKTKLQNFVRDEYTVQFSLANMRKDLGLVLAEMKQRDSTFPVLTTLETVYAEALERSSDPQDFSAIIKEVERKSKE